MDDPWFMEIQLQKLFGLSPMEAHCVACRQIGMTWSEITDATGLADSTIRTVVRRGMDKMKKKDSFAEIIMLKGNKDIEGVMVKLNALIVLAKFYGKVYKVKTAIGTHTVVIKDVNTNIPGDPQWMNENVFRKADIYGTTNEKQAEERADKLYKAYLDLDKGEDHLGYAVLRYQLDKLGMKYDVIEG